VSLVRGLLIVGVGILLAIGLVWLTLPTMGIVGVVVTQVPVLDHVMSEMGFDDRLQQAVKYALWGVMALTAHHCLIRKTHRFHHFAIGAFGAMACAYLAWYANDRWLAGIKPLDLGDPAIQTQAFDPYSGTPNLCSTKGLAGGEHVYWKYVKIDPLTGVFTHLLKSEEYQELIKQKRDEKEQISNQQHQKADEEKQTQAQLAQQAQELTDLQSKNQALQQKLDDLLKQTAQQPQQSPDTEQSNGVSHQQAVLTDSSPTSAVPVTTQLDQPPAPQVPQDVDIPVAPIAHELQQRMWLRVPLISGHVQLWSNGPFEFGVPPQRPRQVFWGRSTVNGPPGTMVMIRSLSPEATTIWYQHVDDR